MNAEKMYTKNLKKRKYMVPLISDEDNLLSDFLEDIDDIIMGKVLYAINNIIQKTMLISIMIFQPIFESDNKINQFLLAVILLMSG